MTPEALNSHKHSSFLPAIMAATLSGLVLALDLGYSVSLTAKKTLRLALESAGARLELVLNPQVHSSVSLPTPFSSDSWPSAMPWSSPLTPRRLPSRWSGRVVLVCQWCRADTSRRLLLRAVLWTLRRSALTVGRERRSEPASCKRRGASWLPWGWACRWL